MFFRNARASDEPVLGGAVGSDNWIIRFNALKRLHKTVLRYFESVGAPGFF